MRTSNSKTNKERANLSRLDYLKDLLEKGEPSSQEELAQKLERASFNVTQSTVSRDLRKLGAIRTVDSEGQLVYRLESSRTQPIPEPVVSSMQRLIEKIQSNSSQIVIRTQPGSASLVARFLDAHFSSDILGTIAGDDTVFVAPVKTPCSPTLIKRLEQALMNMY